MPASAVSDEEFAAIWAEEGGSPSRVAKRIGVAERNVYARRNRLEGRGVGLPTARSITSTNPDARLHVDVPDGVVLIGSDAHYWPGEPTTAHRAFVHFCKELQPKVVVLNGDVLDGARISRHAPIGWETRPSLIQELEVCQERMHEIALAAGKKCKRYHPLGNHDARFETRLATVAPEYARVHGVHLKDHFPDWQACWSLWVNENTVIKHRFRGGIHGVYQNTLHAGMSMVTGHDHALRVSPLSDYRGTRYGVSSGCLADAYGDQFVDYTEDNPRSHRSGFVVLTYFRGELLWPELVAVRDAGHVEFRGKVIAV